MAPTLDQTERHKHSMETREAANLRCYRCGGTVEQRRVRFHLETDKGLVLVDNVPAHVCTQCGERVFAMEVVHNLERMRDDIEHGRRKMKPASNVGEVAYV